MVPQPQLAPWVPGPCEHPQSEGTCPAMLPALKFTSHLAAPELRTAVLCTDQGMHHSSSRAGWHAGPVAQPAPLTLHQLQLILVGNGQQGQRILQGDHLPYSWVHDGQHILRVEVWPWCRGACSEHVNAERTGMHVRRPPARCSCCARRQLVCSSTGLLVLANSLPTLCEGPPSRFSARRGARTACRLMPTPGAQCARPSPLWHALAL
jgi:hypothetical protein